MWIDWHTGFITRKSKEFFFKLLNIYNTFETLFFYNSTDNTQKNKANVYGGYQMQKDHTIKFLTVKITQINIITCIHTEYIQKNIKKL